MNRQRMNVDTMNPMSRITKPDSKEFSGAELVEHRNLSTEMRQNGFDDLYPGLSPTQTPGCIFELPEELGGNP